MNVTLKALARQIEDAYTLSEGNERVAKCVEIGHLLLQARELVRSDAWESWLAENASITSCIADACMGWAARGVKPGDQICTTFDEALAVYHLALEDGRAIVMQPQRELAPVHNGTWYLRNCNGLLAAVTSKGKVFDRPGGQRLDLVAA